jgi:hypothetical protein
MALKTYELKAVTTTLAVANLKIKKQDYKDFKCVVESFIRRKVCEITAADSSDFNTQMVEDLLSHEIQYLTLVGDKCYTLSCIETPTHYSIVIDALKTEFEWAE